MFLTNVHATEITTENNKLSVGAVPFEGIKVLDVACTLVSLA